MLHETYSELGFKGRQITNKTYFNYCAKEYISSEDKISLVATCFLLCSYLFFFFNVRKILSIQMHISDVKFLKHFVLSSPFND